MTEHILSCSYGKDSLACIGACMELGYPIDRIVHAEVWATDDIPADLPPMVEFKKKADKIIKERWGIEVEHLCAMRGGQKASYENTFYTEVKNKEGEWIRNREKKKCHRDTNFRHIYGFPCQRGAWCNSKLKVSVLDGVKKGNISRFVLQDKPLENKQWEYSRLGKQMGIVLQLGVKDATTKFSRRKESEVVQYLGIASDEPKRIERHKDKKGIVLPLVDIGWTEADAKKWCIDNDLLSPIYTDKCLRGGCWFCHNQGVDQLRQLRHNYPQYWELLLKWDKDSPVTFHTDGHTVHDFDRRFKAEDDGFIKADDRFFWKDLDMQQYNIFNCYNGLERGAE